MSQIPPGVPLPPAGGPGVPGGPGRLPSVEVRPEPRRRRGVVVVAGLLVLVLVVSGAALLIAGLGSEDPAAKFEPSTSQTGPLPSTPDALAAFYDQDLAWKECGRNECATLRVPLDYQQPEGDTIEIAVLKVPAREEDRRIGALVVNPGGPGGSGIGLATGGSAQFGEAITAFYDVVGFDPRGVGQSAPLDCLPTDRLDAFLSYDPDPDTPAEVARVDALVREFGEGCVQRSGDLVRHMSTEEAARDMDVLRAALGQAKLDYLGYSYGTFLGATYADLFPGNVGRFVLDGAIDPSLSNAELSRQQAAGFETALRAYLADCVAGGDCFLGETVDQGARAIRDFLDQLDAAPIPGDGDRVLTEGLGMFGIWMPLYVEAFWPQLTASLQRAIEDGDGSGLLRLSDFYTSRGTDGYEDNSIEALYAVNCLDHSDSIPSEDVAARIADFEKASPTFGHAFAYGLSTCASWPVQSGKKTVALDAAGAPPIVVIGTTRDPATPLVWAQALAAQLESGRLITRDGDGHTGFRQGSACVDDAVEAFLIQGTVPAADLRCS